jgi:hypothetical protein
VVEEMEEEKSRCREEEERRQRDKGWGHADTPGIQVTGHRFTLHYRITALARSVTVYRASMLLPYTTHSAIMAGTAPNPVVFFDIGLSGKCLP